MLAATSCTRQYSQEIGKGLMPGFGMVMPVMMGCFYSDMWTRVKKHSEDFLDELYIFHVPWG